MKHHALEERQEPPSVDEILASIEAGHRAEQANRVTHLAHARDLSPVELYEALDEARSGMKLATDAAHYLDAKARRNAAIVAADERGIRLRSRDDDNDLGL